MHEMALCTEVVDAVLDEANRVDAITVNEVHLVLGEIRDIVEDLFDGFFHHLARETIVEGAILTFTRVPVTAACRACGRAFRVDMKAREACSCPLCGAQDYEVASGMEFYIGSIDVTTKEEWEADDRE